MNLERLHDILSATTCQLRKGDEVEHERKGRLDITRVYAMPHESEARPEIEKVDCSFILVGVNREAAESLKEELIGILLAYPEPDRLAAGPSYIEVGVVIGDQGAAFQLFALGQVLGLWKVITPETMGFHGPLARELAGRGMVMISGFRAETAVEATAKGGAK